MFSHSTDKLPSAFTRLAWSNLAAQSAEQVALAAAPIVAVPVLGAGAGETGLLQTAQTLPFLLMSIPAGVLADRMSRARLMAGAEALRVVSLLAVLALVVSGALSLPLLALPASSAHAERWHSAWRRPHWCRRSSHPNCCRARTDESSSRARPRSRAGRR